MKKLLIILLVLITLFSSTSCEKEDVNETRLENFLTELSTDPSLIVSGGYFAETVDFKTDSREMVLDIDGQTALMEHI